MLDPVTSRVRRLARSAGLADESGSVNILFGFCLIVLVGLVGLGVDYGVAEVVKVKLDNAADSAAVAAVASAKAYVGKNPTDTNMTANAIKAGLDRAGRAFVINAGSLPFATVPSSDGTNSSQCDPSTAGVNSLQIGLTRSADGTTFTSCVAYRTQTQNHFGTMFRSATMTESGTASARATIPLYLDFYLLVDVSGSMGLPASDADQNTLMSKFGCQFACHFPGQTAAFDYAALNNIQLRSGAVNTAVCGLLSLANQQLVTQQYRVGIYPFITQMATLAPLSATITNVASLVGCDLTNLAKLPGTFTALLDTGVSQYTTWSPYPLTLPFLLNYAKYLPETTDPSTGSGAGGTHFESLFSSLQTVISNGAGFGTGAASNNSRPFVFLITDGMQNTQYYGTYTQGFCGGNYNGNTMNSCWNFTGNPSAFKGFPASGFNGSSPQAMDPTKCTALKTAGATISVLYIPYIKLTVGNTNQGETNASNNAIANLPVNLTKCAGTSAGNDGTVWMHTANSSADIGTALQQMFQQAIQETHLTK